jgi:hypothetical protein
MFDNYSIGQILLYGAVLYLFIGLILSQFFARSFANFVNSEPNVRVKVEEKIRRQGTFAYWFSFYSFAVLLWWLMLLLAIIFEVYSRICDDDGED